MDLYEYIEPGLVIAVPVLYVLGMMIKKSSLNDKFIPIILGVTGVLLAAAYNMTSSLPRNFSEAASLIFSSVTQGMLCAACSVYANNIVKQFRKGKANDSDKDGKKAD